MLELLINYIFLCYFCLFLFFCKVKLFIFKFSYIDNIFEIFCISFFFFKVIWNLVVCSNFFFLMYWYRLKERELLLLVWKKKKKLWIIVIFLGEFFVLKVFNFRLFVFGVVWVYRFFVFFFKLRVLSRVVILGINEFLRLIYIVMRLVIC